jgi:protein O-GlcNAc transferase
VLNKAALPRRTEFGLPEDKVIFSCSNQLYKYDPDTFNTWCNILKRVPDRWGLLQSHVRMYKC